jgi:hypothetical protein
MTDEKIEGGRRLTRSSFIKASAGAAAGVAAVSVPGAAALSRDEVGVPTEPSSPTPREPVIAYVRDAERGEVTVMSGTGETTYRDRRLVRRLLKAAPRSSAADGGGDDVLAS